MYISVKFVFTRLKSYLAQLRRHRAWLHIGYITSIFIFFKKISQNTNQDCFGKNAQPDEVYLPKKNFDQHFEQGYFRKNVLSKATRAALDFPQLV